MREVTSCRGWMCEVVEEVVASSVEILSEGKFQPALVSSQEQGLKISSAVSDFQAFKIIIFMSPRLYFASIYLYKDPTTDPECMEVGGRFCRKLSTSASPKLNRPALVLRGSNMLCGRRRSTPSPSNADRLR